MIALACSAALPTIGSKMTEIKATDIFNDSDAPCKRPETQYVYEWTYDAVFMDKNKNRNIRSFSCTIIEINDQEILKMI